jgi:hypothetical protein
MDERMDTRGILFTAALVALATSGCAGHLRENQAVAPELPATLRVENQNFTDMKIYVYREGQEIRLGTANGNSVTSFKLPKGLVFAMTQLRFVAVPFAGRGRSVSEEITVSPGDEIVVTITPT